MQKQLHALFPLEQHNQEKMNLVEIFGLPHQPRLQHLSQRLHLLVP